MIGQLVTHCCQHLGGLYYVRDYLGQSDLVTAFKYFVWPVHEYGGVVFMGASAIHVHKLDPIQQVAESMCQVTFVISLESQCYWLVVHIIRQSMLGTTPGFLPHSYFHYTLLSPVTYNQ